MIDCFKENTAWKKSNLRTEIESKLGSEIQNKDFIQVLKELAKVKGQNVQLKCADS